MVCVFKNSGSYLLDGIDQGHKDLLPQIDTDFHELVLIVRVNS